MISFWGCLIISQLWLTRKETSLCYVWLALAALNGLTYFISEVLFK